MTILNEAEIVAYKATTAGLITNFADAAQNTALEMRDILYRQEQTTLDLLESLQSYAGVINDGVVSTIAVSGTPILWTHYTMNSTSANLLLEADWVNSQVKIFEPALYFNTLRFGGDWAVNEDLTFEIYANGAANPLTPISFTQEGQGVGDPLIISITDVAFIIQSALIIDQGGEDYAKVELWVSSATGSFNVNQAGVTFGIEYNPLSIRTVG